MQIKLEKPTLLAAIAYIVLAILVMLPINIGSLDKIQSQTGEKNKYNFWYRFILLLILLVPMAISLYSINCMIKGKCYTWSYINSGFICGWVVIFVTSALIYQQQGRS